MTSAYSFSMFKHFDTARAIEIPDDLNDLAKVETLQ